MIKPFTNTLLFLIFCFLACTPKANTVQQISSNQRVSNPFEFQFENKTLRGAIETPSTQESTAVVILIPGYGRTDFMEGQWFSKLRDELVALGLSVVLWDKMGCGKSGGTFDSNQSVYNSADEAIAAKLKIPGAEKIGLWGISRAGWICPLINEQFPIDFWITVSGTDDKENFGYLLKSNLIIQGKQEKEAEKLFQAWRKGHQLFCTQADYESYWEATQVLGQDSICRKLFGFNHESNITEEGRKEYETQQKLYTSKGQFDKGSGLWVYIKNFDKKLLKINCPVLALFGENDSQVDWRKTKHLYEKTIGVNPNSALTIKVFENCNHSLQKCVTCGYQEDLSALEWQACDNYYQSMGDWLRNQKIIR